jgi:hypothetical protein
MLRCDKYWPASNSASESFFSLALLIRICLPQKKTRKAEPCGLVGNVRALLLAGTIAIGTRAPLARHIF